MNRQRIAPYPNVYPSSSQYSLPVIFLPDKDDDDDYNNR